MSPRKQRTDREKHQFFVVQDRRCPVCDIEIEYGSAYYEDKPTKLMLCHKCWLLVHHMRKKQGLMLDNAYRLVCNGCVNNKMCDG